MIAVVTTLAGLLIATWASVKAVLASCSLMTDAEVFQKAKSMPPSVLRDQARRIAGRSALRSASRVAAWSLLVFGCGWGAAFIAWGLA